MCGIAGQFHYASSRPVHQSVLQHMADAMLHRGPDDEGFLLDGSLGFAFRRLSIIDLAGGHQPMSDREQSVWVVFNGEIYNYPELRSELESYGHVFHTSSDTEVIVHGYKQWGAEVLNHLNGMFGLAVWDVHRRKLTVARDPFGIKAIYYQLRDGALTFASEIRALAAAGYLGETDPTAVHLFLQYRFTPSPYTIYRDVKKLAAGEMIECDSQGVRIRRWYRRPLTPFSPPKTEQQAFEELTDLYRQAVQRHLLSDVPVGLLLSGGVDSALLLALMGLYDKSWNTYTIGYGSEFPDDELQDAARTASALGARHHSIQIDQAGFESALPRIIASLEEPIASSSIVPMYFVCAHARADVKVALMGQGPDELFGGYRRHLGVRYAQAWSGLPAWTRRLAGSFVESLPRNETLKRGVRALDAADRWSLYRRVLSLAPSDQISALFRTDVQIAGLESAQGDAWRELLTLSSEADLLGGFQFLELRSTLPDELLMYADKLSMAHSLEVRVPYLDRTVVEYVERLPAHLKVHFWERKFIHRRVCRHFLPGEVLRRRKRGFAVNVVDRWFRTSLRGTLGEFLQDPYSEMYRFLSYSAVQDLVAGHRSGRDDNHKLLFSLAVLEQWLRVARVSARPAEQLHR